MQNNKTGLLTTRDTTALRVIMKEETITARNKVAAITVRTTTTMATARTIAKVTDIKEVATTVRPVAIMGI